ncbi:MAG: hypothetical protein U1D99_10835 [Candidatus Omnitrophota bacterium]|nr:hypothetical protein [Candidatus Omnitrophota bacterium]
MKIEARWVLIFIGIFLPLFLTWLRTFNVMLFTWDEMASWTMRAKTLFYEGQFVKSFNSSAAYQPPVWPLTIASQYFLLGGDYDLVSKWNSALASLCLLVMIRACLGMTGLVSWAAWALAGLFMIGCDNWTAYQGLPEDMLLAVLTAAVAFALAWLKNPSAPRALICFAIMCVGVSSLKFEGMIYSLVLGGALWASMRGRLPFKWHLRIVVLFLLPVSVQWFWMLWLDANGYSISVHHLGNAFSWDKILALQGVFEEQFSVFEAAGVFVIASILFFFVDIFGKKWSEQELFLLLAWFGMIVFSVLGGMGWPLEDIGPYYRDVLTRLSVKAMPFLLFLLCLRLRGRGFIRIRGVNGLRKVFGE